MTAPRRWSAALAVIALPVVAILAIFSSEWLEFTFGGALIDLGYRLQDPIHPPAGLAPEALWEEIQGHNSLAARVREVFPRSVHHPTVALIVCMDARIDTNEVVGDTRRYYYVLRLAGSVMSQREEEMLELAVQNGVRVIVMTTHTECAAERTLADPEMRARYPALVRGVEERADRRREFRARPEIARRIADGSLLVVEARIDTATGRLMPEGP